ncbi:hypothetical protein GF312_04260 [Candidatus Poribacteria bacterium]|nr:hypothetical protein [Candidatus Poribacteria bacterium]
MKGELIPQGKFDSDAHTIALWHFDELHGAKVFRDSSDYGYDLTAMNDAEIGPFAVNKYSKLAVIWANIKIK